MNLSVWHYSWSLAAATQGRDLRSPHVPRVNDSAAATCSCCTGVVLCPSHRGWWKPTYFFSLRKVKTSEKLNFVRKGCFRGEKKNRIVIFWADHFSEGDRGSQSIWELQCRCWFIMNQREQPPGASWSLCHFCCLHGISRITETAASHAGGRSGIPSPLCTQEEGYTAVTANE